MDRPCCIYYLYTGCLYASQTGNRTCMDYCSYNGAVVNIVVVAIGDVAMGVHASYGPLILEVSEQRLSE